MGKTENNRTIKLLALDVDGTLFDDNGKISQASIDAMNQAKEAGIEVVPTSGRDYDGIPWNQLKNVDINYVITTNGSAVYEAKTKKCLYEKYLDSGKMIPIFEYLLKKEIYINVFVDGVSYTPVQVYPYIDNLDLPDYVIQHMKENRKGINDLIEYLKNGDAKMQKATLNFQKQEKDKLLNREEVQEYLEECPDIKVVNGGFNNLEFTKAGTNKASGLKLLAEYLGMTMDEVMAVGDSENDIEMLREAGLGIAMGNATDDVKSVADDITLDNGHEGVAAAIEKYIL